MLGPVVTAAPARSTALLLLAGAVLLALVALAADPHGRLLAAPAALLLAALGLRDLLLRPVLAAGAWGLEVVTGLRRRHVPWHSLEGLRVVTDRRTPLLELDLGTTLVVLPRSRLGRDPQEVLAELDAVRPTR